MIRSAQFRQLSDRWIEAVASVVWAKATINILYRWTICQAAVHTSALHRRLLKAGPLELFRSITLSLFRANTPTVCQMWGKTNSNTCQNTIQLGPHLTSWWPTKQSGLTSWFIWLTPIRSGLPIMHCKSRITVSKSDCRAATMPETRMRCPRKCRTSPWAQSVAPVQRIFWLQRTKRYAGS